MPNSPVFRMLSIDTATLRGSVALLEEGATAGELRLSSLETHSGRLLRSIEFLLDSAGWKLGDLGLVVAGIGPGSFTGIRIGVATAIGLAQTLRIPFAGISSFEGIAGRFSFLDRPLGIVLDAQRGQIYFAEYVFDSARAKCVARPSLRDPAELAGRLARRRIVLVGDGIQRLRNSFPWQSAWPRIAGADLFLAADIGRAALRRKRRWRSGSYVSAEPLYIRPPDALKPRPRV